MAVAQSFGGDVETDFTPLRDRKREQRKVVFDEEHDSVCALNPYEK
jgi:hypothetical protein